MTISTCVIVDFDSRIEQIAFFIAKTAKIHHLYWKIPCVLLLSYTKQPHKLDLYFITIKIHILQWYITFVLLLTQTQQQHNSDFSLQNT